MFKFHATGRTLETIEKELLVAKTVKDYEASFSFDESWAGWSKRAVFSNINSKVKKEMVLENDGTCVIPWEVLETHGALLVGVYGLMDDKQRPTLWSDRTFIREGTEPGEPAKEPTPDVIAQIQESTEAAIISGADIDEDGNLIIETKNGGSYNAGPLPEGGGSGGGDGADGLSAYEIAVKYGFEGSEEEWLESLHGEDGHTPEKGVDYFTKEDIADLNIPIVDEFLSETSSNAVANKVVTIRVETLGAEIANTMNDVSLVQTDVQGIQQQINQHAHFKGYFSTNAKIQATEATPNDFAYSAESGTKWVYDEADGWVDTGTPVPDQMTPASDTTPLVNGEASVGTENAYARGDHRHPSDPSKASVAELNALKATMESVLDELHAYAQALVNGGGA